MSVRDGPLPAAPVKVATAFGIAEPELFEVSREEPNRANMSERCSERVASSYARQWPLGARRNDGHAERRSGTHDIYRYRVEPL
jgi:hypothetical protein